MSNITLTAGIRNNLLALQNTAADLTTTQEHLSTGKKVNTAFDNPTSFFTSQSLNNRASDLSGLLDQIGQAQQTLDAANNGLTSLTSLLEQTLSTVQQAQQAPTAGSTSYGAATVTGTLNANLNETIGTVTGTVDLNTLAGGTLGAAGAGNLTISVNGVNHTVALTATSTATTIKNDINGTAGITGVVTASIDGGTGHLILTAANATDNFVVHDNTTAAATHGVGLTAGAGDVSGTSTDLYQQLVAHDGIAEGDALTLQVNGGAAQSIAFGTGAGQVQTVAQLNTALGLLTGGITATAATGANGLSLSANASANPTSLTIGTAGGLDAGNILTAFGLNAGTTAGVATVGASNATRTTLQANYNGLLTQIDQMAGDASYNGVNLLGGDNLTVNFNETGTSSLAIAGVNFNHTGLNLNSAAGTDFQSNGTLAGFTTAINNAITQVRAQTETFGTNSGTITTRQTFEQNMINTLQTGASNLVLADQNQESANLLTLQTQQQLEISSLSIANQANQAVLKLFP
jgi:flagellin-like hook-associated protein FlgL